MADVHRRLALLRPAKPPTQLLSDLQDQADAQAAFAQLQGQVDRRTRPWLPWPCVNALTDCLMPWEWWVICGYTGNGKSSLVLNLIDHFSQAGRNVYVLPLEQGPEILLRAHAALRLGFRPADVLRNRWDRLGPDAQRLVEAELREDHPHVHYNPARSLDVTTLAGAWDEAVAWGADLVVIDHLHRLADDDRRALASIARLLTDLAQQSQLPAIAMAQMNEGPDPDPVRAYRKPILRDIHGSATIAREAHVILGLYRPLRDDAGADEIRAVRDRTQDAYTLAKPGRAGMNLLKHRTDGEHVGRSVELVYRNGRFHDPEELAHAETEARYGL